MENMQRLNWGLRVKKFGDDDIARALIGDGIRRQESEKTRVSFTRAFGIAECVDDAAEIEGVGVITVEAEVVEEGEGFVYVAVQGAEAVDFLGPVGAIGYGFF